MKYSSFLQTGPKGIGKLLTAESGAILGISLAACDYRISISAAVCIPVSILFLFLIRSSESGIKKASCIIASIAAGLAAVYLSFKTFFSLEALLCIMFLAYLINCLTRPESGDREGTMENIRIVVGYGILAVFFPYMICAHEINSWKLLLPSLSIGMFGTSVLADNSKTIRTAAILIGWGLFLSFNLLRIHDIRHYLPFILLPVFLTYIVRTWNGKDVHGQLSGIIVLLFSIFAGAGYLAYLF